MDKTAFLLLDVQRLHVDALEQGDEYARRVKDALGKGPAGENPDHICHDSLFDQGIQKPTLATQ